MGEKNSNRFEYLRFLSLSELLIALSFLTPSPKKNKMKYLYQDFSSMDESSVIIY